MNKFKQDQTDKKIEETKKEVKKYLDKNNKIDAIRYLKNNLNLGFEQSLAFIKNIENSKRMR